MDHSAPGRYMGAGTRATTSQKETRSKLLPGLDRVSKHGRAGESKDRRFSADRNAQATLASPDVRADTNKQVHPSVHQHCSSSNNMEINLNAQLLVPPQLASEFTLLHVSSVLFEYVHQNQHQCPPLFRAVDRKEG